MLNKDFIPHSRPTIRQEELKKTLTCMVSDYIGPGKMVEDFERSLASYLGSPYTVAVSSGTMAFFLILKLLGIKPGDEIILPSYAPKILLNPIYYLKAHPVLVDINPEDYSPSHSHLEQKITPQTKAILTIHLFGNPIDASSYRRYGVPVIENAAQALGGHFEERPCGTLGDYSFFSFYASKMISTGGMGGAITSQDLADQERLAKLIHQKDTTDFAVYYPFFMSDLQASMGLTQLSQLDSFIEYRQKIASFYNDRLLEAKKEPAPIFKNRRQTFFRYIFKSTRIDAEEALSLFHNYHIEAKRPIVIPLHRYLKLPPQEFPQTEMAYRENISLPIYPTLKKTEAEKIIKIAARI